MQVRLLGDIEALSDTGSVPLGSPKQRAVLAILALHAGEIVPTERLIDLLWAEDPPRTAAHSIQIYVSELRKILDASAIVTRAPGYQLVAPRQSIDALEFEHLVAESSKRLVADDRDEAAALLRNALRLWRGPALSDFVYEEFAQPYIERLHDLHLRAIEELASLELANGRAGDALIMLEAAVRDDPLRERSRELLMLALYRAGRHAEALRSYARFAEDLDKQLGLDPSPEIQQLHAALLVHDPGLDLAPTAETALPDTPLRNPYKGLRPFSEADATDFHGRESLVDELVAALRDGRRLVALVGPSGSGKSSVLSAGLIPRLRKGAISGSNRWLLITAQPGARALDDIANVPVGQKLVLIIDPFEDLFTVVDEMPRRRFIQTLTKALERNEGRLSVIVSMRADYYDRPLLHSEIAEAFVAGVINVLPMTAGELEEAITAPARRADVQVDAALVADLVSEVAERPAALPMLQFTLSEMFDQRVDGRLTIAGYRALGGLTGILTRSADEVFATLAPSVQEAAEQVFLRLVRVAGDTVESRRRVAIAELADLHLDPIALSEILEKFGRHRLLSFDRDPTSGRPMVEVAHDAFLRGWQRLAAWIDRHRTALMGRESLLVAVAEWERSGRDADYLATGARLADFTSLFGPGTIELTRRERAFIDAGEARRQNDEAREAAAVADHRRLEVSAKRRLLAFAGAAGLLGATLALGALIIPHVGPAHVGLVAPSRGGVDDQVEAGFRSAVGQFGFVAEERPADGRVSAEDLAVVSDQGVSPIVVFAADADIANEAAKAHPNTKYILFEVTGDAPNAAYVSFADEQGAYLAGAIAALKTKSGVIGFIGGVDIDTIHPFESGFVAGARSISPDIRVLSAYLTEPPDFNGFIDAVAAESKATEMYADGADVIFHAAGIAGAGLFEAATHQSTVDRQLWAIGVDSDQYVTVGDREGSVSADAWRPHILTSVLKRWDAAVYGELRDFAQGRLTGGPRIYGLADHGVDISYSGGFINDIADRVETLRARISDGSISVN